MKVVTRKNSTPIKVYCLPEEKKQIEVKSTAAGLTLSKYLLNIGMGHEIRSLLDQQRIHELAKINGDLGRLGGLLKWWLNDDQRVAEFDTQTLHALLHKIEDNQEKLREVMKGIVYS